MTSEIGDEPDFLHDPDDLAWVAFGYADGDLDDESSAAFERLLETHQSAREALADAVLLAGSVAVAVKAERRGRGKLVAALALAALLLVGFPSMYARVRPGRPSGEAVALAWSGLREEGATPEAGPCTDTDADIDDSIDLLAEPGEGPPNWLLEAAALPPLDDEGRGS